MAAESPKTRPVRLAMHSRKDTDDVYDGIVYQKGAAVLEMLEDWLGAEPFRRSLHRYLTDHQFGSATTTDLARAIQQESGVNAGPVLFSFLDHPGAPVFHFSLVSGEGASKLEIEQGDHPWTAPVCFHAPSGERRCEVVNASHAEVRLPGQPAWMWPNAYGSGYYRSLLTPALLEALVRDGYSQLTGPERLALAGDVASLMSSGDLRAADVMKILPNMARDGEPRVSARATAIALQLAVAAPEAVRAQYAAWLKKTMGLAIIAPEQSRNMEEFFREKQ
jgi:alanyl aminopeptidase